MKGTMWYVINKQNGIILKKFEKQLIIPLFLQMLKYKSEKRTYNFFDFLDFMEDEEQKKLLKYVCKRSHTKNGKKVKFIDVVDSLLCKHTYSQIKHYYYIYICQNNGLRKREPFIVADVVPGEFKEIFVDFFYEHFFNMDSIWNLIETGLKFSKEDFHRNFKEDNMILVCPYCDIDTIINIGNSEIEHFWPKGEYPFLAMSTLNLISSCTSCNRPAEGKGRATYNPVTMPYYEQIGDSMEFSYDIKNGKIHLTSSKINVNNYIKLLKLDKRYGNKFVYEAVEAQAESIYASIRDSEKFSGVKVTEKNIKDYIRNTRGIAEKRSNLYFAMVGVFSDYDRYRDYK